MEQSSFSDTLANERRKLGLSLDQASSTTRVRKRFLEAFESGDFDAMPPVGYARNMVASYARFLGLSPDAILDAFDRDLVRWQRTHPQQKQRSYTSTSISGGEPSQPPQTIQQAQQSRQTSSRRQSSTQHARTSVPSEPQQSRPSGSKLPRRFPATTPSRDSDETLRTPRYPSGIHDDLVGDDRRRDRSEETARRQAVSKSPLNRNKRASDLRGKGSYSAYRGAPNNQRKFIIIAIIVALALLAILIWGITSCTNRAVQTDTTTPITGVNDEPTQTASSTSSTTSQITTQTGSVTSSTTATTPFTVGFSLPENATSDIYLVVDGQVAYSGTAVGPVTESYSATQTVQMTVGNPSVVTVTRDGATVEIAVQADGTGTVDLNASSTTA